MSNIRKLECMNNSTTDTLFATEIKSLSRNQPVHWHNFCEIEYVLDGDGEYILNGVSYKLQKNLMLLATPSDFHEYCFLTETKIINIQFSSEFVNHDIYKTITQPMVINDTNSFYKQLLMSLHNHGPASSNYNQNFIKNMLNSLLFLAYSDKNSISTKNHDAVNNYFHKIILYVNSHFQEQISLAGLSEHLHLRPEYISRLFKKNSNQTFSEYLTEIRLSHAFNLLKLSDMSVYDVATSSGYTSFPHFIRMFKKKYGYPPSQIRKFKKHNK